MKVLYDKRSAAGRVEEKISVLFSKRYYEFIQLWSQTGHWWNPSAEDLLMFLEGDL